nr:hypothetical protein JVH1_4259 [Rhodococcus sp. JVH1]
MIWITGWHLLVVEGYGLGIRTLCVSAERLRDGFYKTHAISPS